MNCPANCREGNIYTRKQQRLEVYGADQPLLGPYRAHKNLENQSNRGYHVFMLDIRRCAVHINQAAGPKDGSRTQKPEKSNSESARNGQIILNLVILELKGDLLWFIRDFIIVNSENSQKQHCCSLKTAQILKLVKVDMDLGSGRALEVLIRAGDIIVYEQQSQPILADIIPKT